MSGLCATAELCAPEVAAGHTGERRQPPGDGGRVCGWEVAATRTCCGATLQSGLAARKFPHKNDPPQGDA